MAKESIKKKTKIESSQANIDVSLCDNGAIYLVGWALFQGDDTCGARVFLCSDGLEAVEIPVVRQIRRDVLQHFGIEEDIALGFSSLTPLSSMCIKALPAGEAKIIVTNYAETIKIKAGQIYINWPDSPINILPKIEKHEIANKKKQKKNFVFAMISRIWSGQLGNFPHSGIAVRPGSVITAEHLIDAKQFIEENPQAYLHIEKNAIQSIVMGLMSVSKNQGLVMIFDHNFGGGANVFSKQVVANFIDGSSDVVRIWYQPNKLKFKAIYHSKQGDAEFDIGDVNNLSRFCMEFETSAIIVNSLWAYLNLPDFLDRLVRLKLYGYTKRLEFFAHDHMGVCPSLFLLDESNRYCGVPDDLSKCDKCLKSNQQDFKIFFHDTDVKQWRTIWLSFLLNCDLIRFFSQSTYLHYSKAYPELEDIGTVVIKGHNVKNISSKHVDPNKLFGGNFNIGVFGHIGLHKGSEVVRNIAKRIEELNDKGKIFVFGSLNGESSGKIGALEIVGSYDTNQMLDLCEEYKIDLAFIPSICPETYSLVTQELKSIGMPIASFDIGGQEELLASYEFGATIKYSDAEHVYDRLKCISTRLIKARNDAYN